MASVEFDQLLATLKAQEAPPIPPTIEEMRAGTEAMGEMLGFEEGTLRTPVNVDGVEAEWFDAPGASRDRVILYLHGGGYVMGSPQSHQGLISKLGADTGVRVLALNYRLAPEYPHPAALEDALAAYRWLLKNGFEASRIALSGDSAGGGLSTALLLAAKSEGLPQPAGAALISPWVDLTGESETHRSRSEKDPFAKQAENVFEIVSGHYLSGGVDAKNPLVSPVFGNLAGIAPLYILVGDYEIMLGDSLMLHDRAQAAGVESTLEVWDEMFHVWPLYYKIIPEGAEAIAKISEFVKGRLS